ncbi:MAG: hypothetical protein MOGMAGMI_02477 [Candidatus Omnitrophica bacterium]|nr:hypothetical protein [Candidatus Omnitrophota bacterium]
MFTVAVKTKVRASDLANGLGDRIGSELDRAGLQVVSLAKRELRDGEKSATGKLMQSLQSGVETTADSRRLWIGMLGYGRWVELGRKPGKEPPVSAIRKWLDRKPQARPQGGYTGEQAKLTLAYSIVNRIGAKRGGLGPPISAILDWIDDRGIKPDRDTVLWGWARMIAAGIAKNGIAPFPFFSKAVAAVWPEFTDRVTRALRGGQ